MAHAQIYTKRYNIAHTVIHKHYTPYSFLICLMATIMQVARDVNLHNLIKLVGLSLLCRWISFSNMGIAAGIRFTFLIDSCSHEQNNILLRSTYIYSWHHSTILIFLIYVNCPRLIQINIH